MESKHQTPSVILKLMGLDKVPPQHQDSVRERQKVLSEDYLQKVASIGVRKKRSSHQHHSLEKEESDDVLKVVKTIRRDKNHNPSKGNGKENPSFYETKVEGVPQELLDASVKWKPETVTSLFNCETCVKAEQGNLPLQQKTNNRLQNVVHGEAGSYETFMLSRSPLDLKDKTFNSRISVSKANPGKGGIGLKYSSLSSSCKDSYLADGLLKEIFCPKSMRVYPKMRHRKKISHQLNFGKQSSRSFSGISEEVSMQKKNVANRVLDTVSSSFFNGYDMLKPASNVSANKIQCSSLFSCSDGSYVGSEAKSDTLEQRDVTEKLLEVGQHGHDSTHQQLPVISKDGNGTRILSCQSGFSNRKFKRKIRCKVGVNYSIARKVPMARPLCAASVIANHCATITKDDLFQKYWGLRRNASANLSTQKSKKPNIDLKDYSEDMNPRSRTEKCPFFSSYFNGNDTEDNCIDLHKMKKRCYGMDLSDKKPMLSHLSNSGPSPTVIDSQILQQKCLMNDDMKNNKHDDRNMSKQSAVVPDSSVDCMLSDAKTEVVGWSHNNLTKQKSESTASVVTPGDSDSLIHTSMIQDIPELQEDSAYSLCSRVDPDSLGSFQEAYEPSPISVLDPTFREDISCISECGAGVYDSSEVDDEGLDLNVSSDEDCGNESIGDFEEKKDIIGISRTEESRDFSYVVEVLTEAGISNKNLFKDLSTWHSAECPISPGVFEILEKKFGEQQHWKRSERRLLFDRINLGLLEILQPHFYVPKWEKPVSRRVNVEPRQDMIEEEMWGLLVSQEKKASKESVDDMLGGEIRWIELGEDVEDIVRETVKLLIEELAEEIVGLEDF